MTLLIFLLFYPIFSIPSSYIFNPFGDFWQQIMRLIRFFSLIECSYLSSDALNCKFWTCAPWIKKFLFLFLFTFLYHDTYNVSYKMKILFKFVFIRISKKVFLTLDLIYTLKRKEKKWKYCTICKKKVNVTRIINIKSNIKSNWIKLYYII